MSPKYLAHVSLACLAMILPPSFAHNDGMPYGIPKSYCETESDVFNHDYGTSTGFLLAGGNTVVIGGVGTITDDGLTLQVPRPQEDGLVPSPMMSLGSGHDGSIPPCPYDPLWDGHYEWAEGGAWLLACESACLTYSGATGGGSILCWGTYADHAQFPQVWVYDHALAGLGFPVFFRLGSDQWNNVPDPGAEINCGDFESEALIDCLNHCQTPHPPGLDGSYHVFVTGTAGHVWSS